MTSVTGAQTHSIAEFLAEAGPSGGNGSQRSPESRFATALARSMTELGIPADQVQVRMREAAKTNAGAPSAREFLITVETSPKETAPPAVEPQPSTAEKTGLDLKQWITKDKWDETLLKADLPAEILHDVKDPADLLNARLDAVRKPTDATVKNQNDGTSQPLNSSGLSTREQADAMLERLRSLGISAGDVEEPPTAKGPFVFDYGSDDRRQFLIDGHSVGHLVERYAKYPVELANRMTMDEWGPKVAT